MIDAKRDEMKDRRRDSVSVHDDATVVAPRFDERESATARPVVPLGMSDHRGQNAGITGGTGASAGGFSLRAVSRHLVLAWAVIATLAAVTFAVYRSARTAEPQVTQQPAAENTAIGATAAPQPVRREVTNAPVRAPKITAARRDSSPSWEVPGWSDRGDVKRDEPVDEELDERARKDEKRRRKEEKKRREEFEKETERALKEARKQAERLRDRVKDEGRARLIGVITGKPGR